VFDLPELGGSEHERVARAWHILFRNSYFRHWKQVYHEPCWFGAGRNGRPLVAAARCVQAHRVRLMSQRVGKEKR
jgi:hypothetical protein